jgi:hypothetical protein
VPKRRGKGRSYVGEADGAGGGVGALVTVTVICDGLILTTLMPGGTAVMTMTV